LIGRKAELAMIVYEFPEAAASCFSVLALEDWIGTGSSSDSKDNANTRHWEDPTLGSRHKNKTISGALQSSSLIVSNDQIESFSFEAQDPQVSSNQASFDPCSLEMQV